MIMILPFPLQRKMIRHEVVNTFQYFIIIIFLFIDEVIKSSNASVHSPTSDGDTRKSVPNKDSYNDDHTGKVWLLIMITLLLST